MTDAVAVWADSEMIVFGAALHEGNVPESRTAIGAAYNPKTDEWRRLPDSGLSPHATTASWNGTELVAWDYLARSQVYDPSRREWLTKPNVEVDTGECFPRSVAIGSDIFGEYCGFMVIYDSKTGIWNTLSQVFAQSQVEPIAASPVVLLLGRNAETDDFWMRAFRAAAGS
ncbi:MAG: hypothetical protein M3546_12495 [Actinomycetota bacterium]|nr:hypothetical protein [Actinomycetota bacterium]